MTVCVAAIGEKAGWLFAASDRMITSGDIEYEPAQTKVEHISNALGILWSGPNELCAEIIPGVYKEVGALIDKDRDTFVPVEQAARMYQKAYQEAWRRRAEAAILAPLGLDFQTFVRGISSMPDSRWHAIKDAIYAFPPLDTQVLVVGRDASGVHIYVVTDDRIVCRDKVGFAAIGAGWRHAEGHLMMARHESSASLLDTLLRVYLAKRSSEIAPFVGRTTDLWFWGMSGLTDPGKNSVPENILSELSMVFDKLQQETERVKTDHASRFSQWLQNLWASQAQATTQEPSTPSGETEGPSASSGEPK